MINLTYRVPNLARQTIWYSQRHMSCEVVPQSANVLGIETSCDDTGCAIVNDSKNILGESLFSQNNIHVRYGGVNPALARELHRENIESAVNEAVLKAQLDMADIHAIAVTTKPGLLASLQIGVKYANYLAKQYKKPLIPIHHMEAHALVARMCNNIPFPYLVLLISGGHCLLGIANDVDKFLLLGRTLDNAPGEVLDKVARRMKLKNMPEYSKISGGEAVELAAQKATDLQQFQFPLPLKRTRNCNFSFSGLKDSLVRSLMAKEREHGIMGGAIIPEVFNLCAAFQLAIGEHIINRVERAILFSQKYNYLPFDKRNLVVSGGVACNNYLYKCLEYLGNKHQYNVYRPPPRLCTDNGVMVAWNGIEKLNKTCKLHSSINNDNIDPNAAFGYSLENEVREADIPVKVTRLNVISET